MALDTLKICAFRDSSPSSSCSSVRTCVPSMASCRTSVPTEMASVQSPPTDVGSRHSAPTEVPTSPSQVPRNDDDQPWDGPVATQTSPRKKSRDDVDSVDSDPLDLKQEKKSVAIQRPASSPTSSSSSTSPRRRSRSPRRPVQARADVPGYMFAQRHSAKPKKMPSSHVVVIVNDARKPKQSSYRASSRGSVSNARLDVGSAPSARGGTASASNSRLDVGAARSSRDAPASASTYRSDRSARVGSSRQRQTVRPVLDHRSSARVGSSQSASRVQRGLLPQPPPPPPPKPSRL